MCRLLWLRAEHSFEITSHLHQFGALCRDSEEYQGHGWGCAWLDDGRWQFHHNIAPIWADDLDQFGKATLFLAHARSAFRDEGVAVENNLSLIHI